MLNVKETLAGDNRQVMVISDLHYEKDYHHRVWEGEAYKWLLRMVRNARPVSLIALGDLGHAWLPADWKELTEMVPVHAIYGNHDNLDALRSARNRDGTRVLAKDGEVRMIAGLKVGFISGIIASDGRLRVKDGVPRRSAEDFLSAAVKLAGVDILATHASPYLPEYGGRYHLSEEFEVLEKVINQVNPLLSVSGHLTAGPYTLSKLGNSTVLRIDSSQAERHCAFLDPDAKQVRIMHDYDVAETGVFSRSP
jgi:Icc-related predicted phosphoesterase